MRSWNIPWGVVLAGFPVENSNFLSVLIPVLSDPSFAILISTLKYTIKERKGGKQKKNNLPYHLRISCEVEEVSFSNPFQPHLETNVMSRGLVVENPKTRDIIKFHSSYYKNTTEVNFEGEVLVYVTPVSRKKSIIKNQRSYTAVNFCPFTISWPLNQVSQRPRFIDWLS